MKYVYLVLLISLSNMVSAYDDHDITEVVEAEGFIVGSDNDLGGIFFYIVDKTNGLCFAGINNAGIGVGGLSSIDCEKLKSTPKIKNYLLGEKLD